MQTTPARVKQYPAWHKRSFHLSTDEIEDPHMVFEEIFKLYDLPCIREHLMEWLTESLSVHNDIPAAIDLLGFYKDMMKLVEAAWQLHENYNTKHAVMPVCRLAGVMRWRVYSLKLHCVEAEVKYKILCLCGNTYHLVKKAK